MAQNQLKYTGLTYDDIQAQITSLLYTDSRFDRFRESSIAQTLIEIFTGTTDILNYYLNRRAEETFFDTAQLKSSVISLSRMFGYVMNRSEPAHAYLKLILTGNIEDNQIQIPYYSKFSYSGNNYVLLNTFTYRLTPTQYDQMNSQGDNFKLEITIGSDQLKGDKLGEHNIEIVQGDIREKVINGANNSQVGAPFQIYKIDDKTFSNIYGDKDYFYNNVTKVWVGENKSDSTLFTIDRRSLLSWDAIASSDSLNEPKKICLIRTATDGNVELLFGDANPNAIATIDDPMATAGFARKGPMTRKDNIYIQYLSTKGSAANANGVIGNKIDFGGKIYNSNNKDITNNISFVFDSNIFGGADDETLDSIKYSAPKIYYSLDRLVSQQDYIAYLKSLTFPIDVKNALAWGEQEERNKSGNFALFKMFNVVLFTVLGSLYAQDKGSNNYYAKKISQYGDAVLDLDYSPYKFQAQGYFNVYMMQQMVNQLEHYTVLDTFKNISGDNFGVGDSNNNNIPTLNQISDNIKSLISTQYPTGKATAKFWYTSDDNDNVSNITSKGEIQIVDLNTLTSTGSQYMNDIANLLSNAFNAFLDVRGNKNENANYNNKAFEPYNTNLVTWDAKSSTGSVSDNDVNVSSASYRFNIAFATDGNTPCYITKLDTDSIWGILGLIDKESYPVATNSYISENNGKISYMITELSKRSQISVKNIYVSPIIHRFNVIGNVYVKSMYDKVKVQTEVMNSIYEWANLNADFNVPIYLSNIVEIIERNNAVVNANITLQPEDCTLGVDGKRKQVYDPSASTNKIYKKYGDSGKILAKFVNGALNAYLNNYKTDPTNIDPITKAPLANNSWEVDMTSQISFFGDRPYNHVLESLCYTLNNYITERSFYDDFAKKVYTQFYKNAVAQQYKNTGELPTYEIDGKPNYSLFIQLNNSNDNSAIQNATISSDFALIMEQIYKDLSYIIMVNMLDSHGNIDVETNSTGVKIRGGYTLGSEIVQLILDGKDRSKNNLPLLNFVYKD